jgi:hypothetical protein
MANSYQENPMPKFQITMVSTNARDWDDLDGLREVVQNYLDGHDHGFTGKLTFQTIDGQHYCCFTNQGYVLPKSAWLIGKSDKGADDRGRHGDGLPTGTMVLVREGVKVFFLNGSEKWTPTIEPAENFDGEDVLTITTRSGSARQSDFTVCVGITKERWDSIKNRYLAFSDIDPAAIRKGGYTGNLIDDPRFKGRIFVKGIYTCTKPDMSFGLDLHDVKLDRDRKVIDTWNVQYEASKILNRLASQDDALLDQVFDLLVAGAGDVEQLHYHDDKLRDGIVSRFQTRFGDAAVAVENASEAIKVEHYGLKGVVVPQSLRKILEHSKGSVDQIVAHAVEINGVYLKDDGLDLEARKVWNLARNLLVLSGSEITADKVRLFDFGKSPAAPRGTHNPVTGEIRVNPVVLNDGPGAVVTLAHELAHDVGRDGTLDHRAREEKILANVIGALLGMIDTAWLTT